MVLRRCCHERVAQASHLMGCQKRGDVVMRGAIRDADSFMLGTLPLQAEWAPSARHFDAAAV